MSVLRFAGRLALQQRVLPVYRAPFFDMLARACEGGLDLLAGEPRAEEAIAVTRELAVARLTPAQNIHLLRGPLYLCWQRGLLPWLESCNPDALILEANPRYLSTPAAARWMRRRGRPVLGWGLGIRPSSHARRFLQLFDGLIAYSRRGADEYAALGFPRGRIFVAPNAAAPRPSAPPPERPATFERATLLFVGRLQARKRVDHLLQACAALTPPPRLLIVGDGPERPALETLARRVFPAAEFVGAKHGPELEPYFARADLFVLPGTGGLAVQQAMAAGLPVLVARGDGTQDDLVRPENGWQVPPDDLTALTEALRAALADPVRLRAMGAESYRIVRDEINLETMVAAFVGALRALTDPQPA